MSVKTSMRLLRAAHRADPVLDVAVTHALLRGVAAARLPPTARVFRAGPTMAFGRLDALRPGYEIARDAAREHGFRPVLRLGGGHAAGYDAGSVVLELVTREQAVAKGIEDRFVEGTDLLVDALRAVGARLYVGELPGEYCPGRWSLHTRSGVKVAGTAQRSIRGAALVSAVVVVEGGARLRRALTAVYSALDLNWDTRTAGALEDANAGVTADAVEDAVVAELARRHSVSDVALDDATLDLARELKASHGR